ncbi:MAG: phenylalanine--tRNA ligase subunit beta [Phycisphaerae bacterium]
MNVSLNWLTDYVDVSTMPVKDLAELCTRIGLNFEGMVETDTDIVLDLEVTSNRPDCLGHLGVAREIAAATGLEFTPPEIPDLPVSGKAGDLCSVQVDEPSLCPRYTARVVRNVKVGSSPQWLVERLEAVGMRSVNNVVDVTNYILMEYAQPLHSFDYDKLAEHKIIVRRGTPGEVLVSIDGTKCRLDNEMLVIADAEKAVAVAGIMGGLDTEVGEGTANVLIEAAQFDPLFTRKTSRKLQLSSESNYRFERGVDPVTLNEASLRACALIIELAGGELAEGVVDVWAESWEPKELTLRPGRTNQLLGYEIPAERQADILDGLGLEAKLDGDVIRCKTLPWRADLQREVDLIEEVARLEGYDKIPVAAKVSHTVSPECTVQKVRKDVGRILTAAGFDEAQTFTFVDADEAELFGYERMVAVDPLTRKTNNILRPTLEMSLLRALKTNQDVGNEDVSLFEMAQIFPAAAAGSLPDESTQVCLATNRDLRVLRGAVETLLARLAPQARIDIRVAEVDWLADGVAAEIILGGQKVGTIGLIDPKVQDRYGLEKPAAVANVNFDALLDHAGEVRTYSPVPRFPNVQRDLSVLIDEQTTWRDIRNAIDTVDQPMRRQVDYVTTYRGKQIPKGKKSLTLAVTYRSDQGTLRSEEVDRQVRQVVDALQQELDAELRK